MSTLTFKFDKLVRDKMPEILKNRGIRLDERVMNSDEYLQGLKDKLLEEAHEVCMTSNPQEIREELADVVEVVRAFAHLHGFTLEDVIEAANQKRMNKGSFELRIYVNSVEIDSDNSVASYYKDRPDQYPEITERQTL